MNFIKNLEDIKLKKNVGIFMCVFLILVYYIYKKMSSCKKSIENMTILDDNQIKRIINKYYLSNEYLIDLTSLSKRLQEKGILIDGDIIVTGNIKADNEINNQTISFTELDKKIEDKSKNLCRDSTIYQRIGAGDNFRDFEFNIGLPSFNNMVASTRYWIFAAHKCKTFIWGFYLQNIPNDTDLVKKGIRIGFYNRNLTRNGILRSQFVILEMDAKSSTNYNIKFMGRIPPNTSNTRGQLGPRILLNNTELDGIKHSFSTLSTEDIPDKDVTFFEGWRNSTLPFNLTIGTSLSAFDLYKISQKLPSIKWL
jgi:hypothetical protein